MTKQGRSAGRAGRPRGGVEARWGSVAGLLVALLIACGSVPYPGDAASDARPGPGEGEARPAAHAASAPPEAGAGVGSASAPARGERSPGEAIPDARTLAGDRCRAVLRRGGVDVASYAGRGADALETPVALRGPIRGLRFQGGGTHPWSSALDCRLAVALLAWTQALEAAGVRAVRHLSMLRPGARVSGSRRVSGHAKGLAIDLAELQLEGEASLVVERDWPKRPHEPPCPEVPDGTDDAGAALVRLVCGAAADDVFQMVITPNHDRAHFNHVHLEVVPEWRDYQWIR